MTRWQLDVTACVCDQLSCKACCFWREYGKDASVAARQIRQGRGSKERADLGYDPSHFPQTSGNITALVPTGSIRLDSVIAFIRLSPASCRSVLPLIVCCLADPAAYFIYLITKERTVPRTDITLSNSFYGDRDTQNRYK